MPIAKPSTRGQLSVKPAVPAAPFNCRRMAVHFLCNIRRNRSVRSLALLEPMVAATDAEGVAPLLRCSGSHAYELTATIRAAAAAIQDGARCRAECRQD